MVYANIRFLLERTDFIRRMNPINSLKKWLLNILVPYIEGSNKKRVRIKNELSFLKLFEVRKIYLLQLRRLSIRELALENKN